MNILVVGSKEQADLIKGKVKGNHKVLFAGFLSESQLEKAEVVFDFNRQDDGENLEEYVDYPDMHVFYGAVNISLAEQAAYTSGVNCYLFGFNAEPSFVERGLLEVSLYREEERAELEKVMKSIGMEFQVVDDRVGMVTPRIISMIINEAYYTVMEGTATKEDIDLGMKLGTNYPMGPFEWAAAWGIASVYEVLDALYEDTKEERYKICPLLKQEYLKAIA